jgi:hypothetical protein
MPADPRGPDAGRDAAAALARVPVPGPQATLGKDQRLFNRLTGQVLRQRERLLAWQAYQGRWRERVAAERAPTHAAIREAQRRLVQQMDVLLEREHAGSSAALGRRQQATLRAQIAAICADLLADGPDAAIEALRDRHAAPARRGRRHDPLLATEAMLREMFGSDVVDGHHADSVEALLDEVRERVDARTSAEAELRRSRAEARASRRGHTRAQQAAERRAQFMKEASQSVREVYRRLASSLHPDRESDPVERDRKTRLMQRANQAYASDDLLSLLALQVEIEQVDASHLSSACATRLAHFNEVLKQQLRTLQVETDACAAPVRDDLDLPMDADQVAADHAFNARIARLRAFRRQLERDARALADPLRRNALLDALAMQREPDEDDGLAVLDALLETAERAGRPRRRR